VEVSEHGIGAPAAYHFDNIGVDAGRQECHGTAGTEGPGIDIAGGKAIVGGGGGDANGGSNERGGDVSLGRIRIDMVERGKRAGMVQSKVFNTADDRGNRAGDGVTAAAMGQSFTTDHVLLGGEPELGEGGPIEGVEGAEHDVENNVPNTQLDITKAEWGGFGGQAVFTASKEVVKANVAEVGSGQAEGVGGEASNPVDFMKEWEWNGFHACWRRVELGVAAVEVSKSIVELAELV